MRASPSTTSARRSFTRSTIHLEHGRSFVIEAPGTSAANLYVQCAELNGKTLDRAWLTHEEVAQGGRLVLHMGPHPSALGHNRASAAADRPSLAGERPVLLADADREDGGVQRVKISAICHSPKTRGSTAISPITTT